MEIAPGLHAIEAHPPGGLMYQYALAGNFVVLIDTGVRGTPAAQIFPYLHSIGRRPADVRLVVVTHADADHCGGLHAIRQEAPAAIMAAHRLDVRWVEHPDLLMAERYNGFRGHFGVGYRDAVNETIRDMQGPPEPINLALAGGEVIYPRPGWPVYIYHVPGHTPGQLCLHDPAGSWAVITDALLGRSQVDTAGNPTAPPAYFDRAAYLGSIELVRGLGVRRLLATHYSFMEGESVAAFLDASRDFVYRTDAVVRQLLKEAPAPLTLRETCELADPRLGPFRSPIGLSGPLHAHLEWLAEGGEAQRVEKDHHPAWQLS